jgi:predicted nucleotide-binding protein (sugar kinase/HSP70/actin superfamily)
MVVAGKNGLEGRALYLPHMDYYAARMFAAAFRSIGVDALPSPDSDAETLLLGKRYTSGEECYPEIVTFGDFLKVTRMEGFKPEKTAFFMPTAPGPCRFGQYAQFQRMILDEIGFEDILIVSPTSATGYEELGEHAQQFIRTGWRGLVAADILRKMLLKTRPYEVEKGNTDRVMDECVSMVCDAIEISGIEHRERLELMFEALEKCRDKFRGIEVRYTEDKPLIGVVGEIFCRLNTYSNDELIRKVENHGGEAWLSGVAGWVWYTNEEQRIRIRRDYQGLEAWKELSKAFLKRHFQRKDEERLYEPFEEDFLGYEEPEVEEIFRNTRPYLPPQCVSGESVLNVGEIIYYYDKGADGAIDISPFTCMHGGIGEEIYHDVSDDHDRIPVRSFTCEETRSDVDDSVGIFMNLATTYMRRKKKRRTYPPYFGE